MSDAEGSTSAISYDKKGNIRAVSDPNANVGKITDTASQGMETYTYDSLNRLKTVKAAEVYEESYTYNAQGLLGAKKQGKNTTAYTYDKTGRMKTMTLEDGTEVSYGYDGNGNILTVTEK